MAVGVSIGVYEVAALIVAAFFVTPQGQKMTADAASSLADAIQQSRDEGRAKPLSIPLSQEQCSDCDPSDKCISLRRKIENMIKQLQDKRAPDIISNTKLPYYNPYRTRPHAEDVLGHQLKFRLVQSELKRRIEEFRKLGCGPLPAGAEEAATADLPRPATPPPPRPE